MNDVWTFMLAGSAGVALGAIFFGGLWWTVRWGVGSRRPALWFLVSILARTGIVLVGFWQFSAGRFDRLMLCLTGFMAARVGVTCLIRFGKQQDSIPEHEAVHAPKS